MSSIEELEAEEARLVALQQELERREFSLNQKRDELKARRYFF